MQFEALALPTAPAESFPEADGMHGVTLDNLRNKAKTHR